MEEDAGRKGELALCQLTGVTVAQKRQMETDPTVMRGGVEGMLGVVGDAGDSDSHWDKTYTGEGKTNRTSSMPGASLCCSANGQMEGTSF